MTLDGSALVALFMVEFVSNCSHSFALSFSKGQARLRKLSPLIASAMAALHGRFTFRVDQATNNPKIMVGATLKIVLGGLLVVTVIGFMKNSNREEII